MAPVFPALPIVIAWIVRPRKPNVLKSSTYECGVETLGDTWVQFRVQYYIYGLIFLVFDVEMVFLFPWAVAYNKMNLFGFVAGFLVHLPVNGRALLRLEEERPGLEVGRG